MKYDIATKRLLEINAKAVLQEICGIDLKEAKLIDLPQEVFTSKLIDSPFFIEIEGKEKIYPALRVANSLERREAPRPFGI